MPVPSGWLVYGSMAYDPSRHTWHDLSSGQSYPVYGGNLGGRPANVRIIQAANAAGIARNPVPELASTNAPGSDVSDSSLGGIDLPDIGQSDIPDVPHSSIPSPSGGPNYQNPSIEVTGDSPNISQALQDYWEAVDQYGYGNFGYDQNNNIVPYLDSGEPSVEINPRGAPQIEGTGITINAGDNPQSNSYTQALADYWEAVDQYGYGNFGYDQNNNIVPYTSNQTQGQGQGQPSPGRQQNPAQQQNNYSNNWSPGQVGTGPGTFQMGTWIPGANPGNLYGLSYGNMGYSLTGVPGTNIPASNSLGTGYNTAVGTSMHMMEGDSSGSSPPGGYGSLAKMVSDAWQGMGTQGKMPTAQARHGG